VYFFLFIVSKQKQSRVNSKASTVKHSYKIFFRARCWLLFWEWN